MTADPRPQRSGRLGRAGVVVTSSEIGSRALTLVRSAVVANLITRADYGLAATFALTVTAIDLTSDVGIRQLVIQNERGDDPRLLRAAQLWNLVRGVVLAVVLFVLAPVIADVFDAPDSDWAFRLLAIVPLFKGLDHLDPPRLNRHMRFGPSAATNLSGELAATIIAVALAFVLRDERALLFGLVGLAVVRTAVSHVVAERPYRLGVDRDVFRLIVTFGWPLLLNGLIIFAILQGDRLLVGAFYSLDELGGYSAALSLAMVPALVLARINGQLLLPVLSSRQRDEARFEVAYRHSIAALGMLSSLMAIGFLTVGPQLLQLTFGDQYDDLAALLAILGVMQAVRLMRAAPSQAALARGETQNTMYANGARLVGVGVAVLLAIQQVAVEWLAAVGLVAEVVALALATSLLRRTHGFAPSLTVRPAVRASLVPVVVAVVVLLGDPSPLAMWGIAAAAAAVTSVVAAGPDTRAWIVERVRASRRRRGGGPSAGGGAPTDATPPDRPALDAPAGGPADDALPDAEAPDTASEASTPPPTDPADRTYTT